MRILSYGKYRRKRLFQSEKGYFSPQVLSDDTIMETLFAYGLPLFAGTLLTEPALRKDIARIDKDRRPRKGPSSAREMPWADVLADAVERNAQGLWRFLLVRVGGDENLAEDVLQETCLQAARSATSIDRPEHLDAWLFGVARNVLRRHWRTLKRRRRNLPEVQVETAAELADQMDTLSLPADQLERREVHEQVMLALTSLPVDDQNLIFRYYFDGQSQTDIAAGLQVSPRAVEGKLYRARQALREKLRHLEKERLSE